MMTCRQLDTKKATSVKSEPKYKCLPWNKDKMSHGLISMMENLLHGKTVFIFEQGPGGFSTHDSWKASGVDTVERVVTAFYHHVSRPRNKLSLHEIHLMQNCQCFACWFLAATKQLYEWYFLSVRLSVRPSVCPSHFFDYVPIIVSSWNFQELSPRTRVTSMQKVKVRGQRSRSQRSRPNLTVSGL